MKLLITLLTVLSLTTGNLFADSEIVPAGLPGGGIIDDPVVDDDCFDVTFCHPITIIVTSYEKVKEAQDALTEDLFATYDCLAGVGISHCGPDQDDLGLHLLWERKACVKDFKSDNGLLNIPGTDFAVRVCHEESGVIVPL